MIQGAKIIQQSSKTTKGDAITEDVTPEDTAIVMYTSGSTGTPKVRNSIKHKAVIRRKNKNLSYQNTL